MCEHCGGKIFCRMHACRHFSDEDLRRYEQETVPHPSIAMTTLGPVRLIDPSVERKKKRRDLLIALSVGVGVFLLIAGEGLIGAAILGGLLIGGITWGALQQR